jgi:hypothetical protein
MLPITTRKLYMFAQHELRQPANTTLYFNGYGRGHKYLRPKFTHYTSIQRCSQHANAARAKTRLTLAVLKELNMNEELNRSI